eukprot:1173191-Amphidinium_carterae.1
MAHVCQACLGDHPMLECLRKRDTPKTEGRYLIKYGSKGFMQSNRLPPGQKLNKITFCVLLMLHRQRFEWCDLGSHLLTRYKERDLTSRWMHWEPQ